MAIIHYGKSAFTGNARTRRHRRRQSLTHLNSGISNTSVFECEEVVLRTAERICQREIRSRVERAVLAPERSSGERASFDNCCLPHVHLYAVN